MTLLYTDPLFLKHDTGRHPERADRLRSVTARLHQTGLVERCTPGRFAPLGEDVVTQVHAPAVVERVKQAAQLGGDWLDGDTFVSPDSFDVALAAAGACAAAVDAVLTGADRTALCLVRPPGHHATPAHSMGFCLFNNVALAVHRAKKAHGLARVLIVDWDVHHGNGTQDVFYEDPEVMFFSIHRFGNGYYPGTGAADETGRGPGLGTTRNEPVRYGTARDAYHGRFRNALEESADRIKPELVLLSAGFDAHRDDPIGFLGLESEDFAVLTREVREVAKAHAGGRLVSCLEGGYNLDALAESVQIHLTELLADQRRLNKDRARRYTIFMTHPETFILIPGRTSRQGTTLNEGKFTAGYVEETGVVQMPPEDMARLGLKNGDRVRLKSPQGQVELRCQAAKAGELPPGLLFLPYGDASSRLMGGDTHCTGMPDSKTFDVELEKGVIMLEYHAAYYQIEDGWYMGVVLDFPGVVTQGKTLNAARRMLRSALEDMADWYMEDGQAFPRPNPRAKDKKAAVLEPIRLSAKAKSGVAS